MHFEMLSRSNAVRTSAVNSYDDDAKAERLLMATLRL